MINQDGIFKYKDFKCEVTDIIKFNVKNNKCYIEVLTYDSVFRRGKYTFTEKDLRAFIYMIKNSWLEIKTNELCISKKNIKIDIRPTKQSYNLEKNCYMTIKINNKCLFCFDIVDSRRFHQAIAQIINGKLSNVLYCGG